MKYLHSRIMDQIGSRVDEVKKLVILNRPLLEELRGAFDDPVKTRKLAAQLQRVDMLLSYLREIGIGLAFLSLCREALGDVTQVSYMLKFVITNLTILLVISIAGAINVQFCDISLFTPKKPLAE